MFLNHSTSINCTEQRVAIGIPSWITMQTWILLPFSILCSLSEWWSSTVNRSKHMGWNQIKPIALLEALFVYCPVLTLYVGLNHVTLPLAKLGRHMHSWLTQRQTVTQLVDRLSWYSQLMYWTDTAIYLEPRLPSGLLCVKFSFLCNNCG